MALAFVVIAALATFIFAQASKLSLSFNGLIEKFTEVFNESMAWASGYFQISPEKIINYISTVKAALFS